MTPSQLSVATGLVNMGALLTTYCRQHIPSDMQDVTAAYGALLLTDTDKPQVMRSFFAEACLQVSEQNSTIVRYLSYVYCLG